MNDIDKIPVKCRDCPYWELASFPWCCGDCTEKMNPKNSEYIKRTDAKKALTALSADLDAETVQRCIEAMNSPKAADVEPKQRWIPVTDNNLPDEGEEVLVYDGCYRVGKIEKGISMNDRERMKRGEIPDPEEWGWNVAEGYFRVRRSEAYKACDEQGNNEKPYCWRVDNGKGTLFGQDVKYWTPLFKPQKEEKELC